MKRMMYVLLGVMAVALAITGCGKKQAGSVEYNMSVIIPETGKTAFLGTPVKNALVMASEDWKDKLTKDNVNLKMTFGDSQGNPQTAVTIYNQQKAAGSVNGMISMLTGQTLALKPLTERDGVLSLFSNFDPTICEGTKTLVRPAYSFAEEGAAVVSVIVEKGAKSVGIIHSTDAATSYLVEKLVAPGLKAKGIVVTIQNFKGGDRDLRTQALVIKKADPDVVLSYAFGADSPFLANTLREQGILGKKYVIGCVDVANAIPGSTTKPFAGMYFFSPPFMLPGYETKNPEYASFKEKYIMRFGVENYVQTSVYAYDSYSMVAQTIQKTRSTDATTLIAELKKSKFNGLAGTYTFKDNGDVVMPICYTHVKDDGSIEVVKEYSGN